MSTTSWRGRTVVLVAALALALALAAAGCGGDDDDASSGGDGGIEVTDVWARTSPAAAETGAAYMVITSAEDDALVGASVPAEIAGETQVHETVAAQDGGGDEGGMDMGDDAAGTTEAGGGEGEMDMGGMTMQEVPRVALPAGEAVTFAPGGYHVMLLELAAPLTAGETFPLTLTFEGGTTQEVQVEVRDDAP